MSGLPDRDLDATEALFILDEDGFMCTSTFVSDSESISLWVVVHTKSRSASVSSESYNKLSSSVSSNQLHTFCILSDIITRNYKKN
jgi:hypothetical protein